MRLRAFLASAATAVVIAGCESSPPTATFDEIRTAPSLAAQSAEFRKEVVRVTDRVHVAVGFGLANSILIEGDDGVVVVDTMESMQEGRAVAKAFREITTKPVAAIVYTHNHTDHVFGAEAFANGRDVPVYAHRTTSAYIDRIVSILRPIITKRSLRMFGGFLDAEAHVNAGIGPRLGIDESSTLGLIRPNRTFDDRLEVEIAGVDLELVHAPGETNDQIFVWLPGERVLLSGDNLYRAFPNLYTIRGTPYRDPSQWVESLDTMRERNPEHLVPSHTRPVSGTQEVASLLTAYRDAIQYVHDQTIRGMNQGLTPDELVESVRLPDHLRLHPHLQELYGTVEWSVRSIFDGNLGWFDGNPTSLRPHGPVARAQRVERLAGGREELRNAAQEALDAGDAQWVLELTDHLLRLDPDDGKSRSLRVAALVRRGEAEENPNARHYYLTRAAELGQGLEIRGPKPSNARMIHSFPLESFFRALAANLDPAKAGDRDEVVVFRFPDVDDAWSIHLRRGVAEVRNGELPSPDLVVTVDSKVWKEMLAELRSPAVAIATEFEVEGGTLDLLRFLALFRPDA